VRGKNQNLFARPGEKKTEPGKMNAEPENQIAPGQKSGGEKTVLFGCEAKP